MSSKIQAELQKATGINPGDDESITDSDYMKRLVKSASKLADDDWEGLSEPAREWVNENVDLMNKKKDLEVFSDHKEPPKEEAKSTRRRSSEEDDKPTTKDAAYGVGDEVEVTKTNGRTTKGVVKILDDDGELVLVDDEGDMGISLDKIESVSVIKAAKKEEPKTSRRRSSEEDEQPAGPGVGDTVKILKTNDRTVEGVITSIDEDDIGYKDEDGEDMTLARSKVKSIEIVKKAKAASKSEDKAEGGEKKRAGKGEDGVSAAQRVFEIVCEDPVDPPSLDDVTKTIQKEGRECNVNTLKINYTTVTKILALLKAGKHLK